MAEKSVTVWTIDHRLGTFFGAETPRGLCALTIPVHSGRDFALLLDRRAPRAEPVTVAPEATESGRQLLAWLAGERTTLDAPLDLSRLSEFRVAVMRAVAGIPFGQTRTYGAIARQVGRPGAARAVGQVMHRNPVPLFVPCHRVLGSGGSLCGFGAGLPMKQALLEMEQGGRLL